VFAGGFAAGGMSSRRRNSEKVFFRLGICRIEDWSGIEHSALWLSELDEDSE
jgi:hypothetical protein